jgi:hypothetical protein
MRMGFSPWTVLFVLLAVLAPRSSRPASGAPEANGCDATPLRPKGRIFYYCDCDGAGADPACAANNGAGDDRNAGTRPTAPRRTLADALARFNGMEAGDTVVLCRGGAWLSSGGQIRNPRCLAERTCDLRDYVPRWASQKTARPRIEAPAGTTVLGMVAPGRHGGYRIWNLDIREPGDIGRGDGIVFFYEDVHDVDVCNVRLEGARLGINVQPSGAYDTRLTIRGSQLYGSGFAALYGGTPGLLVDSNYFENNGLLSTMLMHTVYLIQHGDPPPAMRFVNNEIRTDSRCSGVMLVVHGQSPAGLVIENNLIVNEGGNAHCYGIQTGGSVLAGRFSNVEIRRNRVLFSGIPGANAIEASACASCVVSDNVVMGGGIAIGTSKGGTNGPTTGVAVQNNSVFKGVIRVAAQGDGYVVENNAVWTDDHSCIEVGAPTSRNAHNYCRSRGGVAPGALFADAPRGDLAPIDQGPLAGRGDPEHFSPRSIGERAWSAADRGRTRTPPIDIGAFQRDPGGAAVSPARSRW